MKAGTLKKFIYAIGFFAFLGFLDATYLSAVHFLDSAPGCGESGGCEQVANSEYSVMAGIPVSVFGMLFYLSVILLSVFWIDKGAAFVPKTIFALSAPAFLFSMYLVYLMLYVIEATCWWCMASAVSTTFIFLLSFAVFLKNR